jgi:hypothetical protein
MQSTRIIVVFILALIAAPLVGSARAAEKSDNWKGATLDPKWHITVMGDAQDDAHAVRIDNGTLRITAGGSDIWNDNDNGLFLWQWANGDFRAVIEIRSIEEISEASSVGIMVRASTDHHAPRVYMRAMSKGTHIEARSAIGAKAGPLSHDVGLLPWGDGSGKGPTLQMWLTRTGKQFKAERSLDGGKTWGSLHDADHPDADSVEVQMPNDVLIGIMVGAVNEMVDSGASTTAVLGPFQFTQTTTRPTENGLLVASAVNHKGEPAPFTSTYLVVRTGSQVIGSTKTEAGPSNTGSFFLPAGTYTVTAIGDYYDEGKPESVELKAGQVVEIKAKVGARK